MGLPINKLIIASNSNDILTRVFNTGIYKPLKAKQTISPSMDIQVASNFERLIFDIHSKDSNETLKLMKDLKENGEFKIKKENLNKIHQNFCSESLSDEETKLVINNFYKKEKILIDPHTAVGIGAANKLSLKESIVVLGTAHPSKFFEAVFKETGVKPELPDSLKKILNEKEEYEKLPNNIQNVQNYILQKV